MSNSERVRRAEFALETYDGVVNRLVKLYSKQSQIIGDGDIQVVPVPTLEDAEAALQNKNMKLNLPYIAVAQGESEINTASYNPSVMRKYGVKSKLSDDRKTWTIIRAVPMVVTFQIMLVTDDFVTMQRMLDRWVSNEIWGFVLDANDYSVRIKVIPNKSFGPAPRTPDSGGTDQFRQSTSLRVETYSGYLWQVPSVYYVDTSIGVVDNPDISFSQLQDLDDDDVDQFQITRRDDPNDHKPEA